MNIIFIQIKGGQVLTFIWQAFTDGVFPKGPILAGEKGYVRELKIRDCPAVFGTFRGNFIGENT